MKSILPYPAAGAAVAMVALALLLAAWLTWGRIQSVYVLDGQLTIEAITIEAEPGGGPASDSHTTFSMTPESAAVPLLLAVALLVGVGIVTFCAARSIQSKRP